MAGSVVAKTIHFVLHHTNSKPTLVPDAAVGFNFDGAPWLGVIAPKRCAKRAVTRNTIKRQIYAIARDAAILGLAPLPSGGYVIRLRAEFSRKNFPSATSDALKNAVRLELLVLFAKGAK